MINKITVYVLIFIALCQICLASSELADQATNNLQLRKSFWGHEYKTSSTQDKWLGIGWHGSVVKDVLKKDDKSMKYFNDYMSWSWINDVLIYGGIIYFWSSYLPGSTRINSQFKIETTEAKYNFTGLAIMIVGGILRNVIEIPALENAVKAYNNK